MSRFQVLLTSVVTLCFAIVSVWASAYAVTPNQRPAFPLQGIVTTNANLRAGPDTSFATVGTVTTGRYLRLVGCNDDCTWYKTDAGNWIFGELVDTSTAQTQTPHTASNLLPTSTPNNAVKSPIVLVDGNLRAGPSTKLARVGQVAKGDVLNLVGQTPAGDWFQLDNGNWIAAFLVANAPSDLPVLLVPTTAATPVPQSNPTTVQTSSNLKVEFINPHYNCEQGENDYRTGEIYWGYRSFQVDMYVTNAGTEPLQPPWEPTRWIITDGTNDYISDLFWQWVYRGDPGLYPQPIIQPGQTAGWTFLAYTIDRNQWVKAVEYEHDGVLFRQEFDLGPYGNAYNYRDCGEPRPHEFRPTATPRAAAAGL